MLRTKLLRFAPESAKIVVDQNFVCRQGAYIVPKTALWWRTFPINVPSDFEPMLRLWM